MSTLRTKQLQECMSNCVQMNVDLRSLLNQIYNMLSIAVKVCTFQVLITFIRFDNWTKLHSVYKCY